LFWSDRSDYLSYRLRQLAYKRRYGRIWSFCAIAASSLSRSRTVCIALPGVPSRFSFKFANAAEIFGVCPARISAAPSIAHSLFRSHSLWFFRCRIRPSCHAHHSPFHFDLRLSLSRSSSKDSPSPAYLATGRAPSGRLALPPLKSRFFLRKLRSHRLNLRFQRVSLAFQRCRCSSWSAGAAHPPLSPSFLRQSCRTRQHRPPPT